MTRVEKYHRYREEIANMKVEQVSDKKRTSQAIEEIRKSSNNQRLSYDDVINTYGVEEEKKKALKAKKIKAIVIAIVGIIVIGCLIILAFKEW